MSLSSEHTHRRAVQSLIFGQTPSCHCLPGATPCTSGPPNLAGIPNRKKEERKVYASQRPRALRKGPLTSKLARASPK
eukprot:413288-Pelagomonas_calceolata.AAC.1